MKNVEVNLSKETVELSKLVASLPRRPFVLAQDVEETIRFICLNTPSREIPRKVKMVLDSERRIHEIVEDVRYAHVVNAIKFKTVVLDSILETQQLAFYR